MTALRALWRDDRPVLVTLTLFVLGGVALGLFLPLPAGAARTPAEAAATRRLELEAWLWLAWPAWLAALSLLVWLRVRAVNARGRRDVRPPLRVIRRYGEEHPPLTLPSRPSRTRRSA